MAIASKWWALWIAVAALTACQPLGIDQQSKAVARSVFDQVHTLDEGAIDARVAPELRTPANLAQLSEIRQRIPPGEPCGRKLIHTDFLNNADGKTVTTLEEYDYGDRVAVVQAQIYEPAGLSKWEIRGFNFNIFARKEFLASTFSLTGKPASQYLFLVAVILSPLLMIAALIKTIRSHGLKLKWLWCVAALLGLFSFKMNWATGGVSIEWISVNLIGTAALRGASVFSPWILSTTLPVGTLLFDFGEDLGKSVKGPFDGESTYLSKRPVTTAF